MTGQNECSDNDGELDLLIFGIIRSSLAARSAVFSAVTEDQPWSVRRIPADRFSGQVSTSTVTWLSPFSPASRFL